MKLLATAIISVLTAAAANGQELQKPLAFDSGGRFREWTVKLEAATGLFGEQKGFQKALLWGGDSISVLEIYNSEGRLSRTMGSGQLDSLRSLVDSLLLGRGRAALLNQEGRGTLLWSQLPLSLGWYGSAVVAIIDPERGTTASGIYCLSAAGSFFLPMAITKKSQVSKAQANLAVGFGYLGLPVGWAAAAALGADDVRPIFSSMLATSVAGQFAGFRLSRGMDYGQSDVLLHSSFWGAAEGIMLATALQDDVRAEPSAAGLLLGTAGGSYLGWRSSRRSGISDGEAMFVTAAGLAAGMSGFYCTMLAAGEDLDRVRRGALLSTMGGSLAGLYLGKKLARGYSFTKGDGYIINGAVAGGALLGSGVGFLLLPRDAGDVRTIRLMSVTALAGTAAGYLVGLRTVRQSGRRDQLGFELELNPVGLAGIASGRARLAGANPLLTVRF